MAPYTSKDGCYTYSDYDIANTTATTCSVWTVTGYTDSTGNFGSRVIKETLKEMRLRLRSYLRNFFNVDIEAGSYLKSNLSIVPKKDIMARFIRPPTLMSVTQIYRQKRKSWLQKELL